MTGRTHDLAAATALGAVVLLQPLRTYTLATAIVAVFANLIGGIFPDIDQPTAPFWRNLPIGKYFGKIFDRLLGGHRFLTHSIIGLALFGFLAKLFLVFLQPVMHNVNIGYVWWSFMIGMTSHLVMDSFTKEGVPWLLPVPVKFGFPPIKKLRIRTGHWAENLIILPLLIFIDIWMYLHQYQKVLTIIHHRII
ncbi:MAG TPA: metal-dependent hydrolase [Candidatus Saccharimonadales bacterium]|nr:metal-dependent hydrolase [Candidatus Saccharimonadales bacterium]